MDPVMENWKESMQPVSNPRQTSVSGSQLSGIPPVAAPMSAVGPADLDRLSHQQLSHQVRLLDTVNDRVWMPAIC